MSSTFRPGDSQSAAAPAPDRGADLGAALRERFDIKRAIDECDEHSVYLARDLNERAGGPGGEGLVRVKVLSAPLAVDSRQVNLFRLEAAAAASLSHPNILRTSEAQELNGLHFCVTEEKPGAKTLRDHLKLKGWLDADEALRITLQVADALEYAHSLGVLHLNLDPEKILLDEEGGVFVADFGIGRSKDLMWARQMRSHRCPARYISPEQILSGDADQRSDLYLLGIIIFEMLTDRAPFESDDRAALRLKHLTRTPQPPHMFRQELAGPLSAVVMDLLSKRPDGRPFDMAAFKSALEKSRAAALPVPEGFEAAEPLEEGSIEEDPAAWPQPHEEERAPYDEPSRDATAAVVDEEKTPESRYHDLPAIDVIEEPFEEALEYEQVEPVAAAPVFVTGEAGGERSRRLVWVIVLLLLGGGILWAVRDAGFQGGEAVGSTASSAVAEARSVDEPAASKADSKAGVSAPAPEIETPIAVESKDTGREGKAAAAKRKEGEKESASSQGEKEAALSPPAPARVEPELAPPRLSSIEPVLLPKDVSPAELKRGALDYREPAALPPRPERPARVEPAGPKVIRRSGDVLQNTAIVRARPVYPEEARAAGVRGAVTVEVTVDEDGNVVAARAISGPEQLRAAAVAAARRWKWMPARVDRNRARVVGTITLSFRD